MIYNIEYRFYILQLSSANQGSCEGCEAKCGMVKPNVMPILVIIMIIPDTIIKMLMMVMVVTMMMMMVIRFSRQSALSTSSSSSPTSAKPSVPVS